MSFDYADAPPTIGSMVRDWSNCWAMARSELHDLPKEEQLDRALVAYFDGIRECYGMDEVAVKTSIRAIYVSGTHVPATMRAAINRLFSSPSSRAMRKRKVWRAWIAASLIWVAAAFVMFMVVSDGGSEEVERWSAAAAGVPAVGALAIALIRWARK